MSENQGNSPRRRSPVEGEHGVVEVAENQNAGVETKNDREQPEQENITGDRPNTAVSEQLFVNEDSSNLLELGPIVNKEPQLHTIPEKGSEEQTERAGNQTEAASKDRAEPSPHNKSATASPSHAETADSEKQTESAPYESETETPTPDSQTATPAPQAHTNTSDPKQTADEVTENPGGDDEADRLNLLPPAKRQRTELPEFDPTNPSGLSKELASKRVPGKLIEKLWAKLDPAPLKSFDRVSSIVLNRVLENLRGEGATESKISEAGKEISASYIDAEDHRSFRARLGATNLPPPSSMQSLAKMSAAEASQIDILSADQLLRKKQYLDTYLLAELKQLNELERHHSTISDAYELDLQYLRQFRKTTAVNQDQMHQETRSKREALKLDSVRQDDDIALLRDDTGAFTRFKPDDDDDVRDVLQELSTHLAGIAGNTADLTALNDKLEVLYNILDSV